MKAFCGVKSIKGIVTLTFLVSFVVSPTAYIVTQVLLYNKTIEDPEVISGALSLAAGQGFAVLSLIAIRKLREFLV